MVLRVQLISHLDSSYGIAGMIYGYLPMSVLMMALDPVDIPMLLTTPPVPHIPVVGPTALVDIQGGGGHHIEGGEGVGEDGLNDRPTQVLYNIPYLRARRIRTANRAWGS